MSSTDTTLRSAALPPGSVLAGKYRIDHLVAEGGMGLVYRGWHLVLDQPVAVKVMRAELAQRADASVRFLNEARAAARLRGPNIARVLDSGALENEGKTSLYMVLEYLDGADLRTVLENEGALSLPRAVDYVLGACEALAEAHHAGIIHRDIKPENLFLTRQADGADIIKLLDFGISKRMDAGAANDTQDGQSLGSPHYMAPEQMSNPAGVDARADVWSLGIVAYELVSERVPFDGDTVATICAQVLGRDAVPLQAICPELPAAFDAAVQRCLRKRPDERYQNVLEMAEALAPFGTSKSRESLRHIERLLGGGPTLEVDVDVSEFARHYERQQHDQEQRRSSGTIGREVSGELTLAIPPRSSWRKRVAFGAAAVAAVAAFTFPGGSDAQSLRSRAAQAFSSITGQPVVTLVEPAAGVNSAPHTSSHVTATIQAAKGADLAPEPEAAQPDALNLPSEADPTSSILQPEATGAADPARAVAPVRSAQRSLPARPVTRYVGRAAPAAKALSTPLVLPAEATSPRARQGSALPAPVPAEELIPPYRTDKGATLDRDTSGLDAENRYGLARPSLATAR